MPAEVATHAAPPRSAGGNSARYASISTRRASNDMTR
jgi:hypothetical protein